MVIYRDTNISGKDKVGYRRKNHFIFIMCTADKYLCQNSRSILFQLQLSLISTIFQCAYRGYQLMANALIFQYLPQKVLELYYFIRSMKIFMVRFVKISTILFSINLAESSLNFFGI